MGRVYMKPLEDVPRKLLTIEEGLKGIHSKVKLLSVVCENTERFPDFFKYFNLKVSGHSYRGYIYLPYGPGRDALFGSLFYFLDGKAKVLRAYPKIAYADSIEMFGEYVYCEEKIDGTNLGFWGESSANQHFSKTRGTPTAIGASFNGVSFLDVAKKTKLMPNIEILVDEDYTVFTELYGYENPCEYVKYTVPQAQKGLDIIDRKTHKFLNEKSKRELFQNYEIPIAEIEWQGVLTEDTLNWMVRRSAEKYSIPDGTEGMVAKTWVNSIGDQAFGKIKCEECRQLAYIMAGGQIKLPEIKKAVRKALESIAITESFSELFELARQELLEDYPESLVLSAGSKIRDQLDFIFPKVTFDIWSTLDGMKLESYEDKSKIMPTLSKKFNTMTPGTIYNAYLLYRRKRGDVIG